MILGAGGWKASVALSDGSCLKVNVPFYTFNPTTILNVRLSYDRFNDGNPIDSAALKEDLGIKTPFQVVPQQFPYISIDGYQDFFPGTYGQSVNNIYSVQGTLSKTVSLPIPSTSASAGWTQPPASSLPWRVTGSVDFPGTPVRPSAPV